MTKNVLSFLTFVFWTRGSQTQPSRHLTLKIWLFVPSGHQRQDQDQAYLPLFYPVTTDILPIRQKDKKIVNIVIANKMWLKKNSSVSISHKCFTFLLRFYSHDLMNLKQNFMKNHFSIRYILISYILRKILGGIGYKYDATSLQRLWCMLCDQKLWLCSSTTKP